MSRPVHPVALLVLGVCAWSGAALAQTGATVSVPQLNARESPGASIRADQLSVPAAAVGRGGRADLGGAPPQIGDVTPTAEAAPALSSRAQGRAVATAPLGGEDRCDPAAPFAATPACAGRLETRAGDFPRRSAAPVSAEGRLLVLTGETAAMTPASAARQLGGSGAALDAATAGAAGEVAAALAQPDAAKPPPDGGAVATPPVVVFSPR